MPNPANPTKPPPGLNQTGGYGIAVDPYPGASIVQGGVSDLGNATEGAITAADAIPKLIGKLLSGETWIRVGEFLVGSVLIIVATNVILKGDSAPNAAKKVALSPLKGAKLVASRGTAKQSREYAQTEAANSAARAAQRQAHDEYIRAETRNIKSAQSVIAGSKARQQLQRERGSR